MLTPAPTAATQGKCRFHSAAATPKDQDPCIDPHPHPATFSLGGLGAFCVAPGGTGLLTPARRFLSSPVDTLRWVAREYGSVASFRAPNNKLYYIVADPKVTRAVLRDTDRGADPLEKSEFLADGAGFIIGINTVLVLSNDRWKQQHRLLAPYLSIGSSVYVSSSRRVSANASPGVSAPPACD